MPFKIYSCGSNGKGQLGDGTFDDRSTLVSCLFTDGNVMMDAIEHRPLQISCGGNHTFILCEGGILYSTGDNSCGQRDIGRLTGSKADEDKDGDGRLNKFKRPDNHASNIFLRHHWNDPWRFVACGWETTMALCASRDGLIAFKKGSNLKGELGFHLDEAYGVDAELGVNEMNVTSMQCGMSHTILRTKSGGLKGWGSNSKGQLGRVAVASLRNLDLDFEGIDTSRKYFISVARDTTMILQPPNSIKEYGRKILTGKPFDQSNRRVIDMVSMWTSVHVVYEENGETSIWSDGKDSHGQLLDAPIPNACKYAFGSEHGLVLTGDNRVYAWGWGEHGNCGVQDDHKSVTFSRPNSIYEGKDPVRMIEGGQATSWVVCEVVEEHACD